MTGLAATLHAWLERGDGAVLITIAEARGSTPREVGARMLVGLGATLGTVGGGRLEWEAVATARRMLDGGAAVAVLDMPLGPALGQCCGGHVTLRLERADSGTVALLDKLESGEAERRPHVLLFGAGHVGKAIAAALAPLPLAVRWIDERAHEFPDPMPPGVKRVVSANALDHVAAAPAGSGYLILTHSHALDFAIAAAVLDRGDAAYAGLIGSSTKRRRFEREYMARGGDPARLERLICPIGGALKGDKRPAVIAALVAAEVLMAMETYDPPPTLLGEVRRRQGHPENPSPHPHHVVGPSLPRRGRGRGIVPYLDHLASTPLDPAVLEAMLPWLTHGGNPHARHRPGWAAAEAIDQARRHVAALVGAEQGEVVFTSGATEANNLALLGAVPDGWPVLASVIEHPSVLECLPELHRRGHRTATLPVDSRGMVDLDRLGAALRDGPALVSIMAANNEVGTLQPLAGIAALCRAHDALFHCDAAQLPVPMDGIDLLSLSGHKLYGPTNIGALVVRDGIPLRPLLFGGHQQAGRHAGTLPTALCVGLGEACRLTLTRRDEDARRITALRERLFTMLTEKLPEIRRTSPTDGCLPGCLNVVVPGVDAADLLLDLPDVALSTGSACSTGAEGPSHVLLALGLSPEDAHASFRFGLGRTTTGEDINEAATRFADAVTAWRRGSAS